MRSRPVLDALSEDELIDVAKESLSACRWELGRIAAHWTKRYARGRSDAAFGEAVGMSSDQVYQQRRVWETFADVREEYPGLKWSHFAVAITWDDAAACLSWAEEMQATVAEMRAWRRAQHGEDLSIDALEDETDPLGDRPHDSSAAVHADRLDQVATREVSPPPTAYSPFRKGAEPKKAVESAEPLPVDQFELIAKRVTRALEASATSLGSEFGDRLDSLPWDVRQPLINAIYRFEEILGIVRSAGYEGEDR